MLIANKYERKQETSIKPYPTNGVEVKKVSCKDGVAAKITKNKVE